MPALPLLSARRRKRSRLALALAGGVLLVGASPWVGLHLPMRWSARLVGLEAAAGLRLRSGLCAARMLARRPIVLLGDSRLEALGAGGSEVRGRVVVPATLPGSTARFWAATVRTTALEAAPATYVVWLGVNDLLHDRADAGTVLSSLRAITDRALQAQESSVVVLEQIPVRLPNAGEAARIDRASQAVNQGLVRIARTRSRVTVVPLFERFAACGECYADALHPSARGEREIGRLLAAAVRAVR